MFGARCQRLLKPLMKNFWLMTMTATVSSSCKRPMATWFPWRKAGTGQFHIIWPMEKYMSTARKSREDQRRRFKSGVSWSARASSGLAALAEAAFSTPFLDAP